MNAARPERDVRQSIIDAATRGFEKNGYEATSVSEIVAEAGVTKGGFYHYFSSKEDLLLLIHDEFMDYEHKIMDEIESSGLGPREALAMVIEEVSVSVERFRPQITVFFEQRRFLSEEKFAQVRKRRGDFERRVVRIVEQGIREGVFREDIESARILAFGIIGMCSWGYQWYRPGGIPMRTIGQMYARTVLDGLTAERDQA